MAELGLGGSFGTSRWESQDFTDERRRIVEERRRRAVDGRRKDINKHSLNLVDGDKRPICKFRECYAYSLSVVTL